MPKMTPVWQKEIDLGGWVPGRPIAPLRVCSPTKGPGNPSFPPELSTCRTTKDPFLPETLIPDQCRTAMFSMGENTVGTPKAISDL